MSNKKKIWLGAVSLLILLPVILLTTLWLLISTPGGTKWLLEQGSDLAADQQVYISYAAIRGTLVDKLEIDEFRVKLGAQSGQSNAIDTKGDNTNGEISLKEFVLQWQPASLFDRQILIDRVKVHHLLVNIPSSEQVEDQADHLEQQETSSAPEIPDLVLPFDVEIKQLDIASVFIGSTETPAVIDQLALQALLNKESLSVNDIQFSNAQAALQGQLNTKVSKPHQLQASFDVQAVLPEQIQSNTQLVITGEILKPEVNVTVVKPYQVNLQAKLDITQSKPSFNLQASWPQLQWPLMGEAQVQSATGKLSANGNPDNYQLQLNTVLTGQQLPQTGLSLTASGNSKRISFQEILLNTLEGTFNLQGELGFSPVIDWNFSVVADAVNPGVIDPQLQGKLNGQVAVKGRLEGENLSSKIQISEIAGQLRDYPLAVAGELEYLNNKIAAQDLKFNLGANHLLLNGGIGEFMNFDVDIQAPKLDQIYPQLAGSITGKAKLGGKPELPDVELNLDATQIVFQDNDLGHVVFTGEWHQKQGSILLEGENLSLAGENINKLTAKLDGEFARHNLSLNLVAPDKSLALQLDGVLSENFGNWKASINQFDSVLQAFQWQLKSPAGLLVSAEQYQLKDFCLTGQSESICLDGNWLAKQQQLKADAVLTNYDLNQLKAVLPDGLQITGHVSGKLHAEGKLDNMIAKASLEPTDGVISFKNNEEQIDIAYRDIVLKADYKNDQADINLNFLIGENGKGNGKFKIGKSPERKLNGNLTASLPDLRVVQGFVPDLQDFNGMLDMNMQLAGNLTEPVINGRIKLVDARANIPAAGIELKDINLTVESDKSRFLKLQAQVNSGDGSLKADGKIDAFSFPADIELVIKGDKFQVARLPEAIVEVSPDLKLEGSDTLKLTGKLLVPTAKMEVQQVPESAVKVSGDEVIVGEEVEEKKAKNIIADINLELGENVSFKGFGLQTGLIGNIDAKYDGKTSRLFGKIELKDADYSAFGQSLDVEKGRLIFAGPTDNPGIDLKAKRTSLDKTVIAYLSVTGQASKPSIRVYSNPSLPEAEALAYLITGRPMNQARGDSGSEISAAALSLGLTKTMPALKRIQEGTGLDDFRIDSGAGGIEGTSLMMGKYLNPDLYIGYVHGLFDAQGGVKVNYRLTDRIEVESFSGDKESVDIYYRYEHD